MNLWLRQGTKAEVITPAQHDALIALAPKVEAPNGLSPDESAMLSSWLQFGSPVASSGLGGLIDRRADLYQPREAWLDRNVVSSGLDADAWRDVWAALDDNALQRAAEEVKKRTKGGSGA